MLLVEVVIVVVDWDKDSSWSVDSFVEDLGNTVKRWNETSTTNQNGVVDTRIEGSGVYKTIEVTLQNKNNDSHRKGPR